MSTSKLPERASLEYLKKLAKERLADLRRVDPRTKLASALLAVARDHGFSSWRALKGEIERRQAAQVTSFIQAASNGDVDALRALLASDPGLARADSVDAQHGYRGWTALHEAAKRGHLDAVRLLLEQGADPNARETGDNTYPLHWAAALGHADVVRALLEAGGDVHGFGDLHEGDAIGWATLGHDAIHERVVQLLLERGARHHIFSAIAVGDLNLIRRLVEDNPEALDRRRSRYEQRQTPLHFAISRHRYDILDLLIELGADLEAEDMHGETALATAMLHGDQEAMRRLHDAGAKPPEAIDTSNFRARMAELSGSVRKGIPTILVPDVARALDWYTSIGFRELVRYGEDGYVNFGMVSFGKAELMLNMHGKPGAHDVTLWFYTDKVDSLYQLLKSRRLEAANSQLAGRPGDVEGIEFAQDIEDMFYGARQFGIRDPNGYILYFIQPQDAHQ